MSDERATLNPRPIAPQMPTGGPPAPAAAAPPVAMGEPDLTGQSLDGRYQIMQRLGEGTLTRVYEGRHSSGRHFAIKVLLSSYAAKPALLDRFLQLARNASQLRHTNVVAIEEFGYTPTRSVYAAVELIVGHTLQAILQRDGRWSWVQARPVAIQLAAALAAAHQAGLVHQSLKPSNVFLILDPRGKRDPLVKVSDFGLAQVGVEGNQGDPGATTTSMFGDPDYMAPEQGMEGRISPASDIYALGVVLFQLLTGQVPFSGGNPFQTISMHAQKPVPSPRALEPSIPEAVEQIIMRCLAKAPQQRFGMAAEIEQALSAVPGAPDAGAPGSASAENSSPRFARMNAGGSGAPGLPTAPPPKQPSVIVAGTLGDGGGGISGELGGGLPPLPPPASSIPVSEATSSFLAMRPGLRMGLGAGLGGDGPAPPATVAPGSAVASPTMGPGMLNLRNMPSLPDPVGPPPAPVGGGYSPGAGLPDPVGPHAGIGAGMPMPMPELHGSPGMGMGPGYPQGMGPGMPPPDSASPPGMGPGYPRSMGPGIPPPDSASPPGMGPGYPQSMGPGIPPLDPMSSPGMGHGMLLPDPMSPPGMGPGFPRSAGPGMPPPDPMGPPGMGPGFPRGMGPGMPPPEPGGMPGGGYGSDGIRRGMGPGMPPREGMGEGMGGGMGPGMPPRPGVGPGMPPPAGVGPGMPMPMDGRSGPHAVVSSSPSIPHVEPPVLSERVEYDDEEGPKRRPLLVIGIALGVILGGAGLGWLIVGNNDDEDGEIAKVTRTEKNQEVDPDDPEPEPEPDDPEPEPEITPTDPKPAKKKVDKPLTFEQVLGAMKRRIRKDCKGLGPGPVTIDTLVVKDGGAAIAPKVKPKNPVGECARRIVEQTRFPPSDTDHPVKETLDW
ncbi:MAG: protein kinase [Myxococcales bacterium]|nr:protein kinase [Myxococcales bacterium]MCB9714103.1 protein kinase [Myxococcales bacterium]